MFDINSVNKRYFDIKIGKTSYKVEPCSVKTLKRMEEMKKGLDEAKIDDLTDIIKRIIDKNVDEKKISADTINELDMDQLTYILMAYFTWLADVKNSPNL